MLQSFFENWFLLVVLSCCIAVGLFYLRKFKNLPTEAQIKIIKEILYSLVLQAEKELGGKTGQAKFALVIELFYSVCPMDLRKLITEKTIMIWVNEAVERMKEYFKSNPDGVENILKTKE